MPKSRQPAEVWEETRRIVWGRDGGCCQSPLSPPICQGKPFIALESCHIDHIRSGKHGTNRLENQRVLCRACHVLRSDMRHQGMISDALRDGIIPANWREYVWD
jgi:5-methylcytosine-specific restriction protein A